MKSTGPILNLADVLTNIPSSPLPSVCCSLASFLFTVFVNDLDSDVVNRVWKFADDVKMIRNVGTVKGVREFREDLTRMENVG